MKVSILILNFNGSKFLEGLFASLANQTFKDFEVVFVDNKSTDLSLNLLTRILDDEANKKLIVKTIELEKNFGFCQGNNIGLKYTSGENIVFLNNDTYLAPSWLAELVDVINSSPYIGACQSKLIQPQTGKVQTDGWCLDRYGWAEKLILNPSDRKKSRIPFYVSGACMILRKTDLVKLSGFDEDLFFGDYDICWRLRLLGYDMAVADSSLCFHFGSIATDMLYSKVYLLYLNYREILRVLLKNYSRTNVVRRFPLTLAFMGCKTAYWIFKCRSPLFLISMVKAIAWNLKKLKSTFFLRLESQKIRVSTDDRIEASMLKYSVILTRSNLT